MVDFMENPSFFSPISGNNNKSSTRRYSQGREGREGREDRWDEVWTIYTIDWIAREIEREKKRKSTMSWPLSLSDVGWFVHFISPSIVASTKRPIMKFELCAPTGSYLAWGPHCIGADMTQRWVCCNL